MEKLTYRLAVESDAAAILAIYEPYIKDTAVTFECETPTLAEFTQRVRGISADYPYIVCLADGGIAGYAYAHRQMERDAYQWNAELSVYIGSAWQGRGIGMVLYGALIEILRLQNIRSVYGGVTLPNEASEKLHSACGFAKLGTYHNTGWKCGSWHDVAWFEKQIGEYDLKPQPFRSIRTLPDGAVDRILARCAASR